jgi:hypothetical protein
MMPPGTSPKEAFATTVTRSSRPIRKSAVPIETGPIGAVSTGQPRVSTMPKGYHASLVAPPRQIGEAKYPSFR